ncbi:hypothetical protein ACU8KH_05348 [Lachancea thermotolerans]
MISPCIIRYQDTYEAADQEQLPGFKGDIMLSWWDNTGSALPVCLIQGKN